MADVPYTGNNPQVPKTLFPGFDDAQDISRAILYAQTGGCGGLQLAATQKYRDPAVYLPANNKLVPTLAIYAATAIVLADCVFMAGKEMRDHTGAVLTGLTLEANIIHFISLTSFTVTSGTTVKVMLGAPWLALVTP